MLGGQLKGNTQWREEIKTLNQERETFHSTLPLSQYPPAKMPGTAKETEAGAVRGAERPAAPTHLQPPWLPEGREGRPAAWSVLSKSARKRG